MFEIQSSLIEHFVPSKDYRHRHYSLLRGFLARFRFSCVFGFRFRPFPFGTEYKILALAVLSLLAISHPLLLLSLFPFQLSVALLVPEVEKEQGMQDHLESLAEQPLGFYIALSSGRSFGQHFFGSIFVVSAFEDLVATQQLSEIYTYLTKKKFQHIE